MASAQNTTFQVLKIWDAIGVHVESVEKVTKRILWIIQNFARELIQKKNNDLHLLILNRKLSEQAKESFSTEVPLASCEKLQNIQTIEDSLLNTYHAKEEDLLAHL